MCKKKNIKVILTSQKAHEAVTTLINMNNAVGYVTHVDDTKRDAEFDSIIRQAYFLVTKTKLDITNIDIKLHDALLTLVMEANLAYEHFCQEKKNAKLISLLLLANDQATQKLIEFND